MFENIIKFFKNIGKKEEKNNETENSKDAAKERLHLVLMQDRANVSADFLELMKQEIIEVIKKYIEVDESAIDVRLTNKENEDGTNGAPALYANIPIVNIKNEARKVDAKKEKNENEKTNEENKDVKKEEWYFKGHFPGNPIMPGVLITESLAQAGAIAILSKEENKGKNALFGGIDKLKFKKQVVPGDRLKLEVKIIKKKGPIGVGEGIATVNRKASCQR